MNIAKFYSDAGAGRFQMYTARISQGPNPVASRARIGDEMHLRGFSPHRPRAIRPHRHPAQQPGYSQPSEQQRRRARQKARSTADRRSRLSSDI